MAERKRIMEIKGIPPKLITAGFIKVGQKGEKKVSSQGNEFRQPETLRHFKLTTTERGEDENLIEDFRLTEELKSSGQCSVDKDGNIVGIPVRLLYNDINLNFPHRMASYKGGNLICEGNGESSWNRLDEFKVERKCPCEKFDSEYTGKDKCKYAGTLTVMLDAATLFGQTHKFTTTGKNSVEGLVAGLKLIMSATQGKIAGLPLMLTLNNLTTKTPTNYTTTVPVVGLCYRGNALQLRDEVRGLIENDNQFQIDMAQIEANAYNSGGGVVVDDDVEHQKEFHPNSAQHIKEDAIDAEFSEKNTETSTLSTESQGNATETPEKVTIDENTSSVDEQKSPKVIEQEKLTLRLKKMADPTKATSLMKRLNTEFLIQYIQDFYPVGMPAEKKQKPFYVKLATDFIGSQLWIDKTNAFIENYSEKIELDEGAAGPVGEVKSEFNKSKKDLHPFVEKLNAMGSDQTAIAGAIRTEFPEYILNGTLSPSLLIAEAVKFIERRDKENSEIKKTVQDINEVKNAHQETTPESSDEQDDSPFSEFSYEDDPRYYAESSDEISGRPELVQCAMKKKTKKIDDKVWSCLISRFKDSSGETITKAVVDGVYKLTKKQIKFLLDLMDEEIPF